MPPCIMSKRRRKRKQREDLLLFTTCLSALLTLVKLSCLFTPCLSVLVLSWLISSVAQLCLTLGDLIDCSTPGLPTHHQPGVYANLCSRSWWCHPVTLSSVVPFSSCLQSFSATGSFPMSQFFTSGGQSIGVSASASFLLMNI